MKKFKNIYIEITKACNLKCPFCPSSNMKQKDMIKLDDFKQIIDQIKNYTDGIYLHILGEPLLHPELFSMIEYASKYLKVSLTTNGHILKQNLSQIINSNMYILNLSMQSLINESDEFIDNYLNNILTLIKNKHDNLNIHLRIWNNQNTNFKLNQKLKKFIDDHKLLTYSNINVSINDEFRWPTLEDEINFNKTSCLGGKKQLGILTNGDIVCCCLDYLGNTKLGNIYQDLFENIINSEQLKKVLEGWNNKNPYFELCKKCTYRNRFMKGKGHESKNN